MKKLAVALLSLSLLPAALAASPLKIVAAIFAALFFVIILGILHLVLQVFMILDCFKRELENKMLWLFLLSLVPLAPVFYYFRVKRKNRGKLALKIVDQMGFASAVVAVVSAVLWINFGILGGLVAVVLSVAARKKDVHSKTGLALGITAFGLQTLFFIAYFGFFFMIFIPATLLEAQAGESWGNLTIDHAVLGVDQDEVNACAGRNTKVFSTSQRICMEPFGVRPFQANKDGLHVFDMDSKIVQENGTVVLYQTRIFEGEETFLHDDELDGGYWTIVDLEDFDSGTYTYTLTVYDLVGRKRGMINKTFEVR
ncbi:PLDc N-terminal domain-containing protein [Candidatus Woesearchaeota archaeon]|nr:PLDc N-terminal domain-containing protein [Candidatus Woesearchaeota archaeon]